MCPSALDWNILCICANGPSQRGQQGVGACKHSLYKWVSDLLLSFLSLRWSVCFLISLSLSHSLSLGHTFFRTRSRAAHFLYFHCVQFRNTHTHTHTLSISNTLSYITQLWIWQCDQNLLTLRHFGKRFTVLGYFWRVHLGFSSESCTYFG